MISTHVLYLRYLVRHKWFVLVAGRKTGVSLWRLIIHDWSKFTPSEWFPYATFFYAPRPIGTPTDSMDRPNVAANVLYERASRQVAFDRAWLHHQHWNKHHWQHFVLRNDDGTTVALRMPETYVREMVADWMGAGRAITGKWEVRSWYAKNRDRILLHDDTRMMVDMLVDMQKGDA